MFSSQAEGKPFRAIDTVIDADTKVRGSGETQQTVQVTPPEGPLDSLEHGVVSNHILRDAASVNGN